MSPILLIRSGPNKVNQRHITGPFLIGRHPSNNLVLEDPKVSRWHAIIIPAVQGYLIRDLQSRNGTFVNGLKVEGRYLNNDDEIKLGLTSLVFKLETRFVGLQAKNAEFNASLSRTATSEPDLSEKRTTYPMDKGKRLSWFWTFLTSMLVFVLGALFGYSSSFVLPRTPKPTLTGSVEKAMPMPPPSPAKYPGEEEKALKKISQSPKTESLRKEALQLWENIQDNFHTVPKGESKIEE